MSAKIQWDGLAEVSRPLTNAPREIRVEAMDIVRDETEGAAAEIQQQYAVQTGRLRNRVRTDYPSSDVITGAVISSAPHSHLYEFGTKVRRTGNGANRGSMPASPVTPAIAVRRRTRMVGRLAEMLRRKGFEVGD
jgi:hypothetical protein